MAASVKIATSGSNDLKSNCTTKQPNPHGGLNMDKPPTMGCQNWPTRRHLCEGGGLNSETIQQELMIVATATLVDAVLNCPQSSMFWRDLWYIGTRATRPSNNVMTGKSSEERLTSELWAQRQPGQAAAVRPSADAATIHRQGLLRRGPKTDAACRRRPPPCRRRTRSGTRGLQARASTSRLLRRMRRPCRRTG